MAALRNSTPSCSYVLRTFVSLAISPPSPRDLTRTSMTFGLDNLNHLSALAGVPYHQRHQSVTEWPRTNSLSLCSQ
jgi:hypothetical protein